MSSNLACEVLDMRIFPNAEVRRADAAVGDNRGGFGEDGARSTNGTSAEVD